jgi:hypothetical protein
MLTEAAVAMPAVHTPPGTRKGRRKAGAVLRIRIMATQTMMYISMKQLESMFTIGSNAPRPIITPAAESAPTQMIEIVGEPNLGST